MARITISNIEIDYELLGDAGAPPIALTPGGRFAKESNDVPGLAKALADGGRRVLLWDRPNCGASDISFEGSSESELHGSVLTELIRALALGPTTLAAGSAGSRVSLIAASRDPDIVSRLALWWISGGSLSLISLAYYYCVDHALAANHGGMEAVASLPGWAEQIKRNPRNRDILLAQEPKRFIQTMERWALAYMPSDISPVPGMAPEHFARLNMPTLIFRNGISDLSHTRATTDWVHRLIPHANMVDPPWPDNEWNRQSLEGMKTGKAPFGCWPALAPALLEFTSS